MNVTPLLMSPSSSNPVISQSPSSYACLLEPLKGRVAIALRRTEYDVHCFLLHFFSYTRPTAGSDREANNHQNHRKLPIVRSENRSKRDNRDANRQTNHPLLSHYSTYSNPLHYLN